MFSLSKEVRDLFSNKKLIIGVSAGVDSISLLHYLIQNGYKEQCIIAHVHHGFRQESDEEFNFVKELSISYKIPFESVHLNIVEYMKENKMTNDEKTARDLRYKFYKRIANKYQTDIVLLGHHGDDLIEGVLMKFLNGYNGKSLIQMKETHLIEGIYYVRPLLNYEKKDIYEYAQSNNLKWFEDISNTDDKYTRNRFRNHIVPLLKEENNQLLQSMKNFSEIKSEEEEYFDLIIEEKYNDLVSEHSLGFKMIDKVKFLELNKVLQRRLLYKIMEKDFTIEGITTNLLDVLIEKISSQNTDYQSLNKYVYVVNSSNFIYLLKEKIFTNKKEYDKKIKKKFSSFKVPVAFRYLEEKNNEYYDIFGNKY